MQTERYETTRPKEILWAELRLAGDIRRAQYEERLGRYMPYKEPPTPVTPRNLRVELAVGIALHGG